MHLAKLDTMTTQQLISLKNQLLSWEAQAFAYTAIPKGIVLFQLLVASQKTELLALGEGEQSSPFA